MDRSRATYEAFDGVELRLLGGQVVRVPAFEVHEAIHFLRLFAAIEGGDQAAHRQFVAEFPARARLLTVPLSALGFALDVGEGEVRRCEQVTVADALALLALLEAAGDQSGWRAQAQFLDRFAAAVALPKGMPPGDAFTLGHAFREECYHALYGLARDFLSHLNSSPGVQVLAMGTESSSTTASTT